jgi:eukaryotic-like serine/threonine-protein kinase
MKTTLSTAQWQKLHALFDQAESLEPTATAALIASTRTEDAQIAESLSAMLAAHHQWQSRTSAAVAGLMEAAVPTAVGTQLGAYRLIKEIGRGGMGVVYLGERSDGQVQQQVAIKVLHTQNLDANTRSRFQREREILARFDHPGIARLLDVGESTSAEPYYVMEYLRGLPIDAHCDQHKLSVRERLQLFQSVCAAVQYAHAQLILHRDIKPSNVIVDAAGVPRLIDFGIAKPIQLLDVEHARQTATHQRYFSPVNAAPEQIRGDAVAVTCDVYQLGTLLHELLCGRPIFSVEGASISALEKKISSITPELPSVVAAESTDQAAQARGFLNARGLSRRLRGDLDAIVQRALRKEPHTRYASVEQLSQDIERHLQDQPVIGRRGNRWYQLSRFVKRNWQAVAVVAAGVAAAAVFTFLLHRQVQQTVAEKDRAVVASKRAEAVTEFLLETFRSGDPAVAKRINAPIGEALKRAHGLIDSKLTTEPLTRAQVLSALADIYDSLGEFAIAEQYSMQALTLFESQVAPSAVNKSESMSSVDANLINTQMRKTAYILNHNSKFEAFQAMVDRLRVFEAEHYPDQPRLWQSQLLEARALWQVDVERACKKGEALVTELMTAPLIDIDALGESLGFIGKSCRVPDEVAADKRLTQLNAAISLIASKKGDDDTQLMELTLGKASLMRLKGEADEAIAILQNLRLRQERIFGPESLSVANTCLVLGDALNKTKRFQEAVTTLKRAHKIYQTVHGDAPNGDLAAVANNLAISYGWGKVDPSKEMEWRAKAYEIGLIAFGPNSRNVGSFATDYGALLRRDGQYEKAEPILRIARTNMSMETSYGFMARLNLAMVLAQKKLWQEVRVLVAECEAGDPAYRQDPYFKADWDNLRAELARQGQP